MTHKKNIQTIWINQSVIRWIKGDTSSLSYVYIYKKKSMFHGKWCDIKQINSMWVDVGHVGVEKP